MYQKYFKFTKKMRKLDILKMSKFMFSFSFLLYVKMIDKILEELPAYYRFKVIFLQKTKCIPPVRPASQQIQTNVPSKLIIKRENVSENQRIPWNNSTVSDIF